MNLKKKNPQVGWSSSYSITSNHCFDIVDETQGTLTFESEVLDVTVVTHDGDLLGVAPDRLRGKHHLQHPRVALHQLQNGRTDVKRGDLHTAIGDYTLFQE